MTPESQRIAIAEACGWKNIYHKPGDGFYGHDPRSGWTERLPNFLSDLNAMHAAVKSLTIPKRSLFDIRLRGFADATSRLVVDLAAKDWADIFISVIDKEEPVSEATVEGLR